MTAYTPTRFGDAGAYRIPDDGRFRTVNFSGGRSSAYMLHQILAAHDGVLPANCRVIFCNTGKERSQTLEFVRRVGEEWGVDVAWLEYDYRHEAKGGKADPKRVHRVVSFESASRNGEPFDKLNRQRKMLPNVTSRSCTTELKVLTIERYTVRELGWPKKLTRRIVGYRYDEPRRWRKGMTEECDLEYPMVHARVARSDVQGFWDAAPFDLGLSSHRGNCDLCFLKGKANLIGTIRDSPGLADWWIEQERRSGEYRELRKPENARFSKRYSFSDLKEIAMQPTLPMLDDEPEDVDCFCTD